jgi:antitoxin component HigA of HigAB toxin-antitoxin module
MKVKPIRTEQDYEQALRRVEELWASPCDSPERDELNALVTLIEAYEDEHYPIDPPKSAGGIDPEQSIKEFRRMSGRGHSRGWRFNRDEIHERT